MATVELAGGRRATYEVVGTGKPTLMLPDLTLSDSPRHRVQPS